MEEEESRLFVFLQPDHVDNFFCSFAGYVKIMKKTRDAVPKPEETQLCVLHGLGPDLLKLVDPCRYALCSCGSYTRTGKLGSSWPFMLTNAGWAAQAAKPAEAAFLPCHVKSSDGAFKQPCPEGLDIFLSLPVLPVLKTVSSWLVHDFGSGSSSKPSDAESRRIFNIIS